MGRKWVYDSNGDVVTLADVADMPHTSGGRGGLPAIEVPADPWLDPAIADDEPPF